MEEMLNMKHLVDTFMPKAEKFIERYKMQKQVKVTALTDKGTSIVSGWFADENKGDEYAAAMAARGMVVVKQYREAQQ